MYLFEIELFVDNIFLYKAFFLDVDVTKPWINQVLMKQLASLLEAIPKGSMLVNNVVEHKNEIVTSDVGITCDNFILMMLTSLVTISFSPKIGGASKCLILGK